MQDALLSDGSNDKSESVGYKPSLRVDVDAGAQDSGNTLSSTPKVASTPHVSTNIFVAGIPPTWTEEMLTDRYKEFGEVVSTKIVKDRHFGFVMFRKPECAHAAINGTHLTRPSPGSTTLLHVSIAMHDEGVDDVPNERLFIRGLPQWATKEHLNQCFSQFGTVTDSAVLMNQMGQCKGSGFIQFSTLAEAVAAVSYGKPLFVDGSSEPLEIKYSESPEVRQQRQERNRNRQKNWAPSPKYGNNGSANKSNNHNFSNTPYQAASAPGFIVSGGGSGSGSISPMVNPPCNPFVNNGSVNNGSNVSSPFPFFPQTLPMMPSPSTAASATGQPMMPYPFMYSPGSSPQQNQAVTQIVYPRGLAGGNNGSSFFGDGRVIIVNKPPLPQKGDLHLCGGPLTEAITRALVQPFGTLDEIKVLDGNAGVIVRMTDVSQHLIIAQQLSGTLFSTGQVLSAGLYA